MASAPFREDFSPDSGGFAFTPSTFPDVNPTEISRTVEQLRQQAELTIVLCNQLQADIAAAPAAPAVEVERPMLLDRGQVAKLLGVSVTTLWRLRQDRAIPEPIAIGSMERWRRDDIEAFIAGRPSKVA